MQQTCTSVQSFTYCSIHWSLQNNDTIEFATLLQSGPEHVGKHLLLVCMSVWQLVLVLVYKDNIQPTTSYIILHTPTNKDNTKNYTIRCWQQNYAESECMTHCCWNKCSVRAKETARCIPHFLCQTGHYAPASQSWQTFKWSMLQVYRFMILMLVKRWTLNMYYKTAIKIRQKVTSSSAIAEKPLEAWYFFD